VELGEVGPLTTGYTGVHRVNPYRLYPVLLGVLCG